MRPQPLLAAALLALATTAHAGDSRTLTGEYVAGEDQPEALEAVFEPAGDGAWTVTFRFSFQGQPHTWTGHAEGSLSEGGLEGRVDNESGERTFTFWGEWQLPEGGGPSTFRGSHAEIENGFEELTGTLTLGL